MVLLLRPTFTQIWRPPLLAATALALVTVACSGGNGGGGNGKAAEGATKRDAGGATATPAARDDEEDPGTDEEGEGVGHKNRARPADETPREIDVLTHVAVDPSEATPDVLCAVKLDKPEDGPQVRSRARALGIPMMVLAYNWIVDWGRDGQFDELDKKRFAKWMDINIAPDSHQMVAIDYEHPYWPELRKPGTSPERLAQIAAVYREIYAFAKARRPKARWGFYGLPRRTHRADEAYAARVRELAPLILRHEDVVFMTIGDDFKGDHNGRDLEDVRKSVELTLAEVGPRPVYVFVRGRYFGRPPMRDEPIPDDEFRAHIGAALDARWRDGNRERKAAGIIFWDGRRDKRPKPASWEELDKMYAGQLALVQDTVRKRRGPAKSGH